MSEALARLHCDYEIKEEYVHEATRLLSNSILKVHKPDLEIDAGDEILKVGGVKNVAAEGIIREEIVKQKTVEEAKKKITLKSDEYERMAQTLIHHVKSEEKLNENGVKQSDLIEWFISQNIQLVNNMDEYNQFTKILRSIINRLLKTERVFMISVDDEDALNRFLKMHPNYAEE